MTDASARVRPGRAVWIGAAAALVLLLAHGLVFRFVIDDAFISLRYARNLVAGQGLVFNPGEPVEGYSNLLWVLLAAAGLKLGLPALLWLRVLGTAAMGGLLVLAPGAVRALAGDRAGSGTWPGVAAQGLIVALGPVACWMLGGLETPLFALLVFACWRTAMGRRPLAAGSLGLLLTLTRPEGIALALFFCGWSLLPGAAAGAPGQRRWLGPAILVAGAAAHLLWRHHTYGWWLPNTYYAKTGDLAGQVRTGLPYAGRFLLRYALPLGALRAAALSQTGLGPLKRRSVVLTMVLLGLWLLYTVLVGGDMLGMFRFYAPLLPVAAVLSAALAAEAGWLARPARAAAVVLPVAAVLLVSSFQGRERRLVDIHMSEANLGGWMLAGDAMAKQLPAGSSIALGPAGYIPWRTNFRTLDFYGIVTPSIAHEHVAFTHGYAGHEKTDGPYIVSRRPDYILIGNVDITERPRQGLIPPLNREVDLVLDKNFQREYEQIWLPVAEGKVLNLFRRKGVSSASR